VKLVLAAVFDEDNQFGANMGTKVQPDWEQGHEVMKNHLRELVGELSG
jgi:hypothetical protein